MKYRLLRGLPGAPAGTTYETQDNGWMLGNNSAGTPHDLLHVSNTKYEGWFELVKEKPTHWRADLGELWWHIKPNLTVAYQNREKAWDAAFEEYHHEIGNYFRTEKQALAAADAIKALLEYVHSTAETKPDSDERYSNIMYIKAAEARIAVQEQ